MHQAGQDRTLSELNHVQVIRNYLNNERVSFMCFIDHFSALDDLRKDINIRYDFLDIVFLTVCAVVSGAEGWKDIKQFGDKKIE